MKCSRCHKIKGLKDFAGDNRKKNGLQARCRDCQNEVRKIKYDTDPQWRRKVLDKSKAVYKRDPSKHSDYLLKTKYGFSIAQYKELFEKQNGLCAICRRPDTKKLAVDHDHKTGKIRGLLCQAHNRAIGMFHDDIKELESAISYLSI